MTENDEDMDETQDQNEVLEADENEEKSDSENEDDYTKTEEDKRPPKFKFECQRTGECCKRETVPINLNDIQRWVKDQTIMRVAYYIKFGQDGDELQLQLAKDDDGYCMLYHRDNKACTIQYNKPLYCKSYPLGYNGENYVVRSKECTGLGKGTLSKEDLKEMRNTAKEEYNCSRKLVDVLPVLYGIFYKQLAEESRNFMSQLSPEEKEKFDKLLKKSDESEEDQ